MDLYNWPTFVQVYTEILAFGSLQSQSTVFLVQAAHHKCDVRINLKLYKVRYRAGRHLKCQHVAKCQVM